MGAALPAGKKNLIRLRRKYLRPDWPLLGRICALGVSSFIMQITESAISAVFNANLAKFGGDIYVTTMTVGTSINQIYFMVIQGFGQGAQPVTGSTTARDAMTGCGRASASLAVVCLIYATVFWGLLQLFMPQIIGLFNSDAVLLETAVPMLRIYFLLTFLFALQNASQSTFVALGEAKKATFFRPVPQGAAADPAHHRSAPAGLRRHRHLCGGAHCGHPFRRHLLYDLPAHLLS